MADIALDVWLYGTLACYGGRAEQRSFASLKRYTSSGGSTMADLPWPTWGCLPKNGESLSSMGG